MNPNGKPDPTMLDHSQAVAVRPRMNMGLVPTTMTEAMKLAELMAASTLVPKDLQKKPADCLMVIQQAVRWQMDPFAVAQECSVIQGKLMHSGKLVAAVVNARGNLRQRLSFSYDGEGDARTITVSGLFHGESEPREIYVTLGKVKTSNTQWAKQPDQQLMYHGARVWARRHTPELMLGIYSREEFADADADIANGISIHHPDDYADGTPERLTKTKELPTFARREQADKDWEARKVNWCAQIDELLEQGATIQDLDDWGAANSAAVLVSPTPIKEAIYRHFKDARRMASANMVVHDSDDAEARSATPDDIVDHEAEEAKKSISQRAIEGRLNNG